MPSTSLESAEFTSVNWAEESGGRFRLRLRTVGLVLALAALVAAFAYDYTQSPAFLVEPLHWDLTRIDWLTLVSIVLLGRYTLVPVFANPERSVRYIRKFLARPAGVLSLAYLIFFAGFSLIGPEVFHFTFAQLDARLQPPVYSSVYLGDNGIRNCVGAMENGWCHGTWQYPFGTNHIGEDMLELLLYSNRVALKIALSVAMIMGVVATTVGVVSGYFGGLVDDLLMRYVDVQQTIPAIVVYLILATLYFGNYQGIAEGGLFVFVLVFGLLDWGGIARLVRSDVLQHRSAGYVRAAKAAGASDFHVIRRHIVPNSTATIVTALTRRIPLLILAHVILVYLQLNNPGVPSFGTIFQQALNNRYMSWHQAWWISTSAVVMLVLTVVSFNVFGDTLRDVLDPEGEVE